MQVMLKCCAKSLKYPGSVKHGKVELMEDNLYRTFSHRSKK
jgi:hypothetical protein